METMARGLYLLKYYNYLNWKSFLRSFLVLIFFNLEYVFENLVRKQLCAPFSQLSTQNVFTKTGWNTWNTS